MTRLLLLLLLAAAVYAQLWYTPFVVPADTAGIDIYNTTVAGSTAKVFYPVVKINMFNITGGCTLHTYDVNMTRRVAEKVRQLLGEAADAAIVYAATNYYANKLIFCERYQYLQLVYDPFNPPSWPVRIYVPKFGLLLGASAVGTSPSSMSTAASTISACNQTFRGFIVYEGHWYVRPSSPGDIHLLEFSTCNVYTLVARTTVIHNASSRNLFAVLYVPPPLGRLWVPIDVYYNTWKYYYAGKFVAMVSATPYSSTCSSYPHFAPLAVDTRICALYDGPVGPSSKYTAVAWLPTYYNSSWGTGVMPAYIASASGPLPRMIIHPDSNGHNRVPFMYAPFLLRVDAEGFSGITLMAANFSYVVQGKSFQFYTVTMLNYEGRRRIGKHAVCNSSEMGTVDATTLPAVAKIRNNSPSKIYVIALNSEYYNWIEEIPPGGEAYVVVTGSGFIGIGLTTPCRYDYLYSSNFANRYAVWNGSRLTAVGELIAQDYELLYQWFNALNATFTELTKLLEQVADIYKSLYNRSDITALTTLLTSPPSAPIPFYATNISTFSSVTIKTYAEALTKFSVSAPPAAFAGAGGTGTPPPPAAGLAAAAAGALGVAWAASRRDDDVATAAAVAGVALALFSLLFTMVYGAQGLSLAALGIIIAAAAAAYKLAVTRS